MALKIFLYFYNTRQSNISNEFQAGVSLCPLIPQYCFIVEDAMDAAKSYIFLRQTQNIRRALINIFANQGSYVKKKLLD